MIASQEFKHQKLILYFLLTGVFEGVLALWGLFLIPGDPKNAWFLGFSKTRFGMAAVLFGVVCVFAVLALLYRYSAGFQKRVNEGSDRVADLFGAAFPGLLGLFGFLVLGPYLVLLTTSPVEEVFVRLSPFILLGTSRLLQLILVSSLSLRDRVRAGKRILEPQNTLKAALGVIAGTLAVAYLSFSWIKATTQHRDVWKLGRYLDLTYEYNIPSFFSAFLLGLAAYFLWLIYRWSAARNRAYRSHWFSLSLIFIALALDEAAQIHEPLGRFAMDLLGFENVRLVPWTYLGILVLIFFSLLFARFYLHLPAREKVGFAVAAVLYVGSALGVEVIMSAVFSSLSMVPRWAYVLVAVLEEITEMVGMIYFIHVLMVYRQSLLGEARNKI